VETAPQNVTKTTVAHALQTVRNLQKMQNVMGKEQSSIAPIMSADLITGFHGERKLRARS
jgi:hypothetical protein